MYHGLLIYRTYYSNYMVFPDHVEQLAFFAAESIERRLDKGVNVGGGIKITLPGWSGSRETKADSEDGKMNH